MRALGIILAEGGSEKMRELSVKRATASMPVGGSYRAIDFALSNMSNSRVQKVAVLTQYNFRSLNEHLSSSKWWDFGRKQGGLFVFPPTITNDNGFWYRGTADAIAQNLTFLRNSHEPYVVIASGDCVYKLDYNKVLEYHIERASDITVVTTEVYAGGTTDRFDVVKTAEDGRILEILETSEVSCGHTVSAGIYVIRRRQLIELMEEAIREKRFDFVKDILIPYKDKKRIYAYKMEGYWSNIASVESYFRTNMDFLNRGIRNYFYKEYPDIYSRIDDLPPAKYNPGAAVKNSLVSSGCIINGRVENSVLFKKIFVGNNCTIKNCIVLNDVHIGDNTYLENCIVESRGTLRPNSEYVGEGGEVRIVVQKDERYTMG